MRDRQQIVEAFASLCSAGEPSALATVGCVEGSSYRRPGARMLIAASGQTWGTISGGCLERDVARRARMLISEPAKPQIICYETDSEEDGEESLRPVADPGPSLGCGGRIEILLQRVTASDPGPLQAIAAVQHRRIPATIATLIRTESIADELLVPGTFVARFGNQQTAGPVPSFLIDEIERQPPVGCAFEINRHRLTDGGWADVLTEWLAPSQSIAIFGDGHDVGPLVEIAKALSWHVMIVGSRAEAALRQNFPGVDQLISTQDPAAAAADLPHDAAAVVMGHNFHRDAAALAELVKKPRAYIGVLGPRRRTGRLLGAADAEENVYSPIGLDLGAENPEQVALAIVAEIQAVAAGCDGQSLRQRPGPIHFVHDEKAKSFSHG